MNRVVVPARQATQPGGIGSLDSILWLRKSSKIRAQILNPVTAEGLYCKRPIQCLASSQILTPHRPGGGHTRWVEMGWGVHSLEDARHCSVLYIYTLCL